jgi:MFS family permease
VCAALDLLSQSTGADAPAARVWALAGVAGLALGPAVGGILTQLFGWESIFALQAPLIAVTLLAIVGVRYAPVPEPAGRPHLAANAALLLVSGALVAAVFLLAILLINGWRLDPLAAGLVLTVMPVAAIVAARFGGRITPLWSRAASGVARRWRR